MPKKMARMLSGDDPLDQSALEEALLDDAARSFVMKNPLLGAGDVWTELKLQGLNASPELEEAKEEAKEGDEDEGEDAAGDAIIASFVLNPLAGLIGPDGKPQVVLVDESEDDGRKKGMFGWRRGGEDGDSDDEGGDGDCRESCLGGKEDPWEDFSAQVEELKSGPPPREERNPFKGEHNSEVLWSSLTDRDLRDTIQRQIRPMNEACQQAHEEIYDKVDVEEAMRRTVAMGESMFDMPPMKIRHFIRTIPSTGDSWERFGVLIYLTNRHLFLFNSATSKANRLERKPILGLFELQRYEITHQRNDDMLMYPLPLSSLKGFSLDIETESHAIATLDKMRTSNCALLGFVMAALAAVCYLVGRFENHPSLVIVSADGSGSGGRAELELEEHLTNFAVHFVYYRWLTFAGAVALIPCALFMLFEHPQLILSPPHALKAEGQKVCVGARDPMTQEHMVLEMHLDDGYPIAQCKEFLRVMQLNSPHLIGHELDEDEMEMHM